MLSASCVRRLALGRISVAYIRISSLSTMPKKRSARSMATATAPVDPPPESADDALSTAIIEVAESADVLGRRFSSRIRAKQVEVAATTKTESDTAAAAAVDDAELSPLSAPEEEDAPPKKKRKRTKKDAEPEVYDIQPVETKTTTWRGRLGYACLNTILRNSKPDPTFCSRTCRLDTISKKGLDFAKDLGKQNARDLLKLIQWNEDNNIRFLRVSSEMFPFASHDKQGYTLEYAADELRAAGDLANKLGHRLTSHPGQFTQLGSPKPNVVKASVRELEYHTSMFELMGIGNDGVIIIHMGGVYGDKPSTLARFKENYRQLPDNVKARLVLENDEICYNVDDLMPVCEELNIPIIFDYHHDWIYPSAQPPEILLPRINDIWHSKGIRPKQHLSSPRPGAVTVMQRRAHSGRCPSLPDALEVEGAGWWWAGEGADRHKEYTDLMIEAKDKEQAVFELYRRYDLQPVIWANLRPAKPDPPFDAPSPTKKRAAKKVAEIAEDEETEDAENVAPEEAGPELGPDEDTVVEVDSMSQAANSPAKRTRSTRKAAPATTHQDDELPAPPTPPTKRRTSRRVAPPRPAEESEDSAMSV